MSVNRSVARMLMSGCLVACFWFGTAEAKLKIEKRPFGKTSDAQQVDLYVLSNRGGLEVGITNYGASVVSIQVPDRTGKFADVALGYDDVAGYEKDKAYLGATVGRYANRIAHGRFSLGDKTYTLAKNDGENTLHGGAVGFNKKVWNARNVSGDDGQALELTYLSKNGEEGFPGNLSVKVTYTLTDHNELRIEYLATTDAETVLNLTNHTYFNLHGHGEGDILGHKLTLPADRFAPSDRGLIPTGKFRAVQGTPFDFRTSTAIGARIEQDDEQLKIGRGYDHGWVLPRSTNGQLVLAAEAYEPASGRVLEVLTTEPDVHLYTGNFLDGTIHGKGGRVYNHRSAFCLETQHFPDSPNHPNFPSTVLKPGETFRSTTVYRFSVRQ